MVLTKNSGKPSKIIGTILLLGIFFIASSGLVAKQQQNMPQQQMNSQGNADVSDKELETFVEVVEKVDSINQDANERMVKIVQDNGLEVEQYNQVMNEMQSAEDTREINADDEVVEKAIEVSGEIRNISAEVNEETTEILQDEGLTPNRYESIMQMVNSDPQVRQRFDEIRGGQ